MAKQILSIEVGSWWTKVCVVTYRKTSSKIYNAFSFRTPEGAVEDGYITDRDAFGSALKKELQDHEIKEREALFVLSSSKIVTREVVMPIVKDNKIMSVIQAQVEEYFPMDVSDYVLSYMRMGQIEQEGKKMQKLLLFAVPDSLLDNYYSFADHVELKVESFDYIGNSAVEILRNSLSGSSVLVQLEPQATIISILSGRQLVFHRVTPYGYGTALSAVLEHPVFEAKDAYGAYEFLLKNEVLFSTPNPQTGTAARMTDEERKAEVMEATEDIRDALNYHLRVVLTALDYYQTQLRGDLGGQIYLIGDGARLAGMFKMFEREMPMPVHTLDYNAYVDVKRFMQEDGTVSSVGFLTTVGAAIAPINVKSKERVAKESRKSSTQSAYVLLVACLLLSVVLMLAANLRRLAAVSEQDTLNEKIASYSYIEEVYNANLAAQQELSTYQTIDDATATDNEMFLEMLGEVEKVLPKKVTVQSVQASESTLSFNMTSTTKIETAQLLIDLRKVDCLTDIAIPSVAESEDSDSGKTEWTFTVTASYCAADEDAEAESE